MTCRVRIGRRGRAAWALGGVSLGAARRARASRGEGGASSWPAPPRPRRPRRVARPPGFSADGSVAATNSVLPKQTLFRVDGNGLSVSGDRLLRRPLVPFDFDDGRVLSPEGCKRRGCSTPPAGSSMTFLSRPRLRSCPNDLVLMRQGLRHYDAVTARSCTWPLFPTCPAVGGDSQRLPLRLAAAARAR